MSKYDGMSLEELQAYRDQLEAQLADERSGDGSDDDETIDYPNIASGQAWTGDSVPQSERKREGFSGFAPNHEVVKLQPTAAEDDEGRPLSYEERFAAMWANLRGEA